MKKLAVFASGSGSNFEAIQQAILNDEIKDAEIVLMVCDKDNIASAKTIIKNGGVLENEFIDENGRVEQRYWIDIK